MELSPILQDETNIWHEYKAKNQCLNIVLLNGHTIELTADDSSLYS